MKLVYLKEISLKLSRNQIKDLPDRFSYITQLLEKGEIYHNISKEEIREAFEKVKNTDILNFSRYVDN